MVVCLLTADLVNGNTYGLERELNGTVYLPTVNISIINDTQSVLSLNYY